ncbi:MAG TPA: hypothetical protein VNX27_00980, partial [Chthoniobacterales bacterium]|nr:hypothetical protein [Chthoniobacterales bacterium]
MKDLKDLSPPLIVAWFRSQAKRFNDMADFVEATFEVKMPKLPDTTITDTDEPTPANIRRVVEKEGHRISDLAKRFNKLPSEIE